MYIPELVKDDALKNISSDKALSLMQEELQKNGGKKKSYFLPQLNLKISADEYDYYVDFGFHDEITSFSRSLDKKFGISFHRENFELGDKFSGGITRMYCYTDADKQDHLVWTIFITLQHYDYINIYLKAHEEAHIIQKLNCTHVLTNNIEKAYPFIKKEDLDCNREEFLAVLGGFIPFAEHGISSLLLMLANANMTNMKEFEEVAKLLNR